MSVDPRASMRLSFIMDGSFILLLLSAAKLEFLGVCGAFGLDVVKRVGLDKYHLSSPTGVHPLHGSQRHSLQKPLKRVTWRLVPRSVVDSHLLRRAGMYTGRTFPVTKGQELRRRQNQVDIRGLSSRSGQVLFSGTCHLFWNKCAPTGTTVFVLD